jgi:hypothetical protein
MDNFRVLKVGKPLAEGVTSYPDGQITADIDESGLFIRVAYADPTKKEIENFKKGAASFGLAEVDNIIFILCKFGDLNWMDAPYESRLSAGAAIDLSEAPPESNAGLAVTVALADARTGIVKSLRLLALSPAQTLALQALVISIHAPAKSATPNTYIIISAQQKKQNIF